VTFASPALLAGLASFLLLLGGCGSSDPEPASDAAASNSAPGTCSTTVASPAAVQEAVASAPAESTVCLADGHYDKLTLDAGERSGEVTVRAEHPAKATIAGASLAGDNLTLSRFVSTDGIQVQPGATAVTIEHNRITGGGEGIEAGPTDTTTLNDIAIVGNQLIGPFGEDAIHLNRYHDSDGDGVGILVEGNEITQVRENGNHSDCLQTVWVGDHIVFRKNYLHDNRCQGFFVKDQASLGGVSGPIHGIVVEDNLFLRNHQPCGAPLKSCGQPLYFQVAGPYTGFKMSRNTIWGDGLDSIAAFRQSTGADTRIEDNVIYRLWTDTEMTPATLRDNTICEREAAPGGAWPQPSGETVACPLEFPGAAKDDYRLGDGRGVDWAPADEHYGP
jgi:Right handed beta helix region